MAAKPTAVKKENTYAAPTESQLKFAETLAIKAGYPRSYAITAARKAMLGKTPVQAMGRQQCSELIEWLQAKIADAS